MEGYTDSAMPLPLPLPLPLPSLSEIPPFGSCSSLDKTTSKKRVRQLGHSNSDTLKIERERRSKMTQMFTQLRTSVPGVFPQATREVIINETISYIKELEKKKQRLEKLKESIKEEEEGRSMLKCNNNNNINCSISVTLSTNVAFFGIQSLPRPGLITMIFKVFFHHQTDILAANVSINNGILILAITALVQNDAHGNAAVEDIKREIMSL